MYVRMLAYIRYNAVLSYRRGYSVAFCMWAALPRGINPAWCRCVVWRMCSIVAACMCSGVVWCIMTASYMWIEVRMMCMRPRRLLAVVRCFVVSV